jgi:hypothetical protein
MTMLMASAKRIFEQVEVIADEFDLLRGAGRGLVL